MRLAVLVAALVALASTASPGQTAADPQLQRIIADSRAVNEGSFGFERTTDVTLGGKRQVRVDRYDPRAAQRWTLLSVDGKPPTAEQAKDYAAASRSTRAPNYGRVGMILASGAARVGADQYRVRPLPAHALDGRMAMFASHLAWEAKVGGPPDRPYVIETRAYAPEPFRARLVAKIDAVEAVTRYAPGPDGRPRVREQVVKVRASAFGKNFDTDQTMRYRDL